jgi:hypothetical protein
MRLRNIDLDDCDIVVVLIKTAVADTAGTEIDSTRITLALAFAVSCYTVATDRSVGFRDRECCQRDSLTRYSLPDSVLEAR